MAGVEKPAKLEEVRAELERLEGLAEKITEAALSDQGASGRHRRARGREAGGGCLRGAGRRAQDPEAEAARDHVLASIESVQSAIRDWYAIDGRYSRLCRWCPGGSGPRDA